MRLIDNLWNVKYFERDLGHKVLGVCGIMCVLYVYFGMDLNCRPFGKLLVFPP